LPEENETVEAKSFGCSPALIRSKRRDLCDMIEGEVSLGTGSAHARLQEISNFDLLRRQITTFSPDSMPVGFQSR
jgi:hypothetical protein